MLLLGTGPCPGTPVLSLGQHFQCSQEVRAALPGRVRFGNASGGVLACAVSDAGPYTGWGRPCNECSSTKGEGGWHDACSGLLSESGGAYWPLATYPCRFLVRVALAKRCYAWDRGYTRGYTYTLNPKTKKNKNKNKSFFHAEPKTTNK